MQEIENIHEHLKTFVASIDPIESCHISEELYRNFGLSIRLPELFDKDFYYESRNFREMVVNMRNEGVLDNYISARKSITNGINNFLIDFSIDDIDINATHVIEIEYDSSSFRFMNISNALLDIFKEMIFMPDFLNFL